MQVPFYWDSAHRCLRLAGGSRRGPGWGVKLARQCDAFTGGSSWMVLPQHLVCPALATQMPGWGADCVGHTTDQRHQEGNPSPGF